ncbi:MAG: aldo/keto reductase [Dehalococcoidia bacterium]|nr:aldo/keto reductase [Dehalococcoidia bacterium]
MNYRQLADTELTLSEIGVPLRPLTTNDYGHVTEQDTINVLGRAFDMGFTFFDTADSYTEGYGEQILAKALGRNRHDIVIATKAGYDFYQPVIDPDERGQSQRWTPGFIQYACEQSLRRLDTDYIDLFQLHHPSPDQIEDDELFGLLDDLVVEGKIRYYGVALDEKSESEETGEGAIDVRSVSSFQAEFGLLKQQPGRNLIARAQGTSCAFLAYDPSASGALERPPDEQSAGAAQNFRKTVYEQREYGRNTLVNALREFGGDVSGWAIKFALASPVVATTLPVITSYSRLLELAEISDSSDVPREFVEAAFSVYDEELANRQVWR